MVFLLALVPRLGLVLLSRGGLGGNFGYDPAVYYTSADALVHGRLPYRDFVLLHPPALTITLTPFALLGRLTSDHVGFVLGNIAFMVLGAVNASLVVVVGRRLQVSEHAALLGGLFYALWLGTATTEISTRLEPLGSFFFLSGLWALLGVRGPMQRRLFVAGLALGASTCVKIWWIVPLLVLLVWQATSRPGRRNCLWIVCGAAISAAAIAGPFFLTAPTAMWRMVVTDQLGRHRSTTLGTRLNDLSSLHAAFPSLRGYLDYAALLLLGAVAVTLSVMAWRVHSARILVVIGVIQLTVLLAAPTYFPYYSGYPAAAFSLVLSAAAEKGTGGWKSRVGLGGSRIVVVCAAIATVAALTFRSSHFVTPFPGKQLAAKVTGVHCVMADSPMALIELNALSRNFAHGCANWVDVSGRTYDIDAPTAGRSVKRTGNLTWQKDIRQYLLSGDAFMFIRKDTGLSTATKRLLMQQPVIAAADGYVVYGTLEN